MMDLVEAIVTNAARDATGSTVITLGDTRSTWPSRGSATMAD